MSDLFPKSFRKTPPELDEGFARCVFVFDANVLLDLFRYQDKTRQVLIKILQSFTDRIWLPHQSLVEFTRNTSEAIPFECKTARNLISALEEVTKKEEETSKGSRADPSPLIQQTANDLKPILDKLRAERDKHLNNRPNENEIRKTVFEVFKDKIGTDYVSPIWEQKIELAACRYRNNIPPGYSDKRDKKDLRRYGDAILWFQILDYARVESRPIYFVTGDHKEDWFEKPSRPRHELLEEMYRETKNSFFHIYATAEFIKHSSKLLGDVVTPEALKEVREVEERKDSSQAEFRLPLTLLRSLLGRRRTVYELSKILQTFPPTQRKHIGSIVVKSLLSNLKDANVPPTATSIPATVVSKSIREGVMEHFDIKPQ